MYHVGIEQTVTIGKRSVGLKRFTRAVMRRWHEWARTRLSPVLASVLRVFDHFPEHCQRILADAAIEAAEAAADFDSPEVSDLWHSDEGVTMLLAFLMDVPEPLAVDLASEAVAQGLPVGSWIGKANGRYTLTPYELESKAYEEAGLIAGQPSRRTPINWPKIDRDIFQNTGLTPCQIDEMTLAELVAVLKAETVCPDSQIDERGQLWHKLTPKQRLQLAIWTADN